MKIIYPTEITIASSNVTGSSYTDWSSSTTYTVGQNVYLASNYGEYEALTNNTNKPPNLNPTDWKFLGTANKYKMFDQFLNTQTSNTSTIEVEIVAYGSMAIYLGNLEASSVLIQVINNDTLEVIETSSFSLLGEVNNWLDYFYGDWVENRLKSVTYQRTTLTRNISYMINIDNGINNAKCGILTTGILKDIGFTKWGMNVGALDYSTVAIDTSSGATYLSRGNYAKRISADIFCYTSAAQAVYKSLTDARGTPIVFINESFDEFNVYGYMQKFETLVNGPIETAISLDIIGLI